MYNLRADQIIYTCMYAYACGRSHSSLSLRLTHPNVVCVIYVIYTMGQTVDMNSAGARAQRTSVITLIAPEAHHKTL